MHVTVEPDVCHRHELPANEMIKSATLIAIRDDFLETNIIVNKGFTVDSRLVTTKCLISVNRERTHVYVKVLGLLEAD